MCVGKTLNMDSCSKFWGNLEGIWGNPGEIPHIRWQIPGVYRVNVKGHMYVICLYRWQCKVCGDTWCRSPPTGGSSVQWGLLAGSVTGLTELNISLYSLI